MLFWQVYLNLSVLHIYYQNAKKYSETESETKMKKIYKKMLLLVWLKLIENIKLEIKYIE